MTARDELRLLGVHTHLVSALRHIFTDFEIAHTPLFVVEGVRTVERQQALYAQGRTTPGPIVTYKDGLVHRSNHQPLAGIGYAVDCAFVPSAGESPFDALHPWQAYGEALEAQGVIWGGRWKMADLPHAEWPRDPVRVAMLGV